MTREIKNRVAVSQPKRNTQTPGQAEKTKLGQAQTIKKTEKGCC